MKLSEVFPQTNFSQEVREAFSKATIQRISIKQDSRVMQVFLSASDGVHESSIFNLRSELRQHFTDIVDVHINIDGPIIPIAFSPPNSNANAPTRGSYRKTKINKTIPTERHSLADELKVDDEICVEGIVFNLDSRVLKSGKILVVFDMYEGLHAISVKLFTTPDENPSIINGAAMVVRGKVQYDDYAGELILMADTIAPGSPLPIRPDNAEEKRVELHLHTTMSSLDAVNSAASYVRRAIAWGHPAIAITDHGVAQAFPEAANAARGSDIKVLYGMEAYLVTDSKVEPKKQRYRHAVIFAANQTGLKNLYALISISHIDDFYRRPLVTKEKLIEHREGLIIGSGCEAGELFKAVIKEEDDAVLEEIASFYDYLEIQPISNNAFMLKDNKTEVHLKDYCRRIVALGERLNKPVVATCDVHFLDPEDEIFRRIIQSGNDYNDADSQPPLYFRTTEEMLAEFEFLGEEKAYEVVVTNTRAIADSIDHLVPIPRQTFPPVVKGAEEKLQKTAFECVYATYGNPLPALVADRMDREMDSIIKNGFAGMYVTAQVLVEESEANGYTVGSRGSIGSSLVATMTGITEVNPLPAHYFCPECRYFESDSSITGVSGFDLPEKDCPNCSNKLNKDGQDIPFETFLGFDGDKEPDIDLNFSGEYQQQAHAHAESIFGKEYVFKSGTIATIAAKTAYGYVMKYFEKKGETKRKAEINRLVLGCTGIKRTTGQHPGGLILVPEGHSVYEFCPVQYPANQSKSGVITTHFDYHSMEGTLFKLDILGHDVPTIIRMLHDFTGVDPRTVPVDDKNALSYFTNADSLGLPEFGTNFVRQMLTETKPVDFSDLVRISGLSHGTDVWTTNAQDLIRNNVATLKEIIPCRDDIMVYLIHMGLEKKLAFKIMESVRKGNGVTADEIEKMMDVGVPEWYIDSCRKIKYLFPKAHAVAYVLMTARIAYFKYHHPEAFYAATFSVKAEDFDYATMCQGESVAKVEYERLKIKTDDKKNGTDSAKDKVTMATLELVLEMYSRGINFAPISLYESEVYRFRPTENGILPPFCTVQGLGRSVAEAVVASRQEGEFDTVDDFKNRTKVNKTVLELLRQYRVLEGMPEANQMSLFD